MKHTAQTSDEVEREAIAISHILKLISAAIIFALGLLIGRLT